MIWDQTPYPGAQKANAIQRRIQEDRERDELETRALQRHGWIEDIHLLSDEQLRSLIKGDGP